MIDINLLRADPEKVKNILKIKNYDLDSDLFTEIDSNRKTLQTEVEDLKSLKKTVSLPEGKKINICLFVRLICLIKISNILIE